MKTFSQCLHLYNMNHGFILIIYYMPPLISALNREKRTEQEKTSYRKIKKGGLCRAYL